MSRKRFEVCRTCARIVAEVEAECEFCGKAEPNDSLFDDKDAAAVLGDAVHLEAQLRRKARALVREHRADIEQVAKALLMFGVRVSQRGRFLGWLDTPPPFFWRANA